MIDTLEHAVVLPDESTVTFGFTLSAEESQFFRNFLRPPEGFSLLMNGTPIGVNGRKVGDSIKFEFTPEALELMKAQRTEPTE